MSYYLLHIPVEATDVKIIKENLQEYLDQCGEMKIIISSDAKEPNTELTEVIRKLFVVLLVELDNGHFQGLN